MNETAAGKAMWFIERHLDDELTLERVAEASGWGSII